MKIRPQNAAVLINFNYRRGFCRHGGRILSVLGPVFAGVDYLACHADGRGFIEIVAHDLAGLFLGFLDRNGREDLLAALERGGEGRDVVGKAHGEEIGDEVGGDNEIGDGPGKDEDILDAY